MLSRRTRIYFSGWYDSAKEAEAASDEAAKPADYMVKLLDEKGEVAMEMLSSELVSRVF